MYKRQALPPLSAIATDDPRLRGVDLDLPLHRMCAAALLPAHASGQAATASAAVATQSSPWASVLHGAANAAERVLHMAHQQIAAWHDRAQASEAARLEAVAQLEPLKAAIARQQDALTETSTQESKYQHELDESNSRANVLDSVVRTVTSERDRLRRDLAAAEARVTALEDERAVLRTQYDMLRAQLVEAEARPTGYAASHPITQLEHLLRNDSASSLALMTLVGRLFPDPAHPASVALMTILDAMSPPASTMSPSAALMQLLRALFAPPTQSPP